jgi:DNA-binding transcriptional LysR family regulator
MRMTRPASLDPDLLRAFVFIAEERSFTRAAQIIGRTQSAVSMQVQRLEALLGEQLLHRGRGGAVELTRHGQFLLQHARDMLALNDEIWRTFHTPAVTGTVCLGTPTRCASCRTSSSGSRKSIRTSRSRSSARRPTNSCPSSAPARSTSP